MEQSTFLILIAFILKRHRVWKKCEIRIFAIASKETNTNVIYRSLEERLYSLRIGARIFVVELEKFAKPQNEHLSKRMALASYKKAIEIESMDADLILLNLPTPDALEQRQPRLYAQLIENLTENLKRVILIRGREERIQE